nr:hypothetical protein [Tanacetum cinerariifolium]
MNANVQGRLAESQAKVYHLDLQHAEKVISMKDTDEAEPVKIEKVTEVVTAAKLMIEVVTTAATTITVAQVPKAKTPRKRRGVVIQDSKKTSTTSVIVHLEDNTLMRYQALKRKPMTEAQARMNMMIYLKNMVGFKMDFFKGMTYNEIRPIIEKHYNLNQAFLERVEEEVTCQKEERSKRKGDSLNQDAAKKQRINEEEEELKAHLQIVVNDDDDDVFTEATPFASKVPVIDYQIHHENNKPYYKIIREDGTHKGRYGLAKVKSWKLFESYGDHIITFTTTQLILLGEKKYPLTRFTLEQMLNNVRLEVEEESEMSLELLRLMRRQLQEGYIPE